MKKGLIIVAALVFCNFAKADTDHHARHGFQLLGTQQVHLYHLARFDSPHEYQALSEVKLFTKEGEALDLAGMRAKLPPEAHGLLAIASSVPMALPDLLQQSEFTADLFSGYLRDRQSSSLLLKDVRVKIIANRFFRKIETGDNSPKHLNIRIVCDEGTGEIFGIHEVSGKPSFEEIISIQALYEPGDLEANIPSIVHGCSGKLQDSRYEVVARPDKPLEDLFWIHGYSNGLGLWASLAGVKRLLLDTQSINN